MGAGANSANRAAIGASTIRSAGVDIVPMPMPMPVRAGVDAEGRADWVRVLRVEPLRALESDRRATAPADGFRLGAAVWLNG